MLETGRKDKELEGLSLLGNQGTKYKFGYDPDILEVFDNKHPNNDYFVKFNCPEFTSLCPIQDNLISQLYILVTFQVKKWLKVNL